MESDVSSWQKMDHPKLRMERVAPRTRSVCKNSLASRVQLRTAADCLSQLVEGCEELVDCLPAGMSCSQSSSKCNWGSLAGSRRAEPVGICSTAAAAVRGMGEKAAGDSVPLGSLTLPLHTTELGLEGVKREQQQHESYLCLCLYVVCLCPGKQLQGNRHSHVHANSCTQSVAPGGNTTPNMHIFRMLHVACMVQPLMSHACA